MAEVFFAFRTVRKPYFLQARISFGSGGGNLRSSSSQSCVKNKRKSLEGSTYTILFYSLEKGFEKTLDL